jgi:hypothetical protein
MNYAQTNVKLFDPRNYSDDPRMALGSVTRRPEWPTSPCYHCWPALITATGYDSHGRPCCALCASNADRRVA